MSLAQNIRGILDGKRTGMTVSEIAGRCEEGPTSTQVALAVHSMMKAGGLIREGERGSYRYRLPPAGATVRLHTTLDEDEDERATVSEAVSAPPQPLNPSAAPAQGTSTREPEETGTRKRGAPRTRRSSAGLLPVPVQSALPVGGTGDASNAVDRDLQIAITEAGVLALRRGDACLFLDPAEVQRMTAFLHRTGAVA